jgi:hypothetical protein
MKDMEKCFAMILKGKTKMEEHGKYGKMPEDKR